MMSADYTRVNVYVHSVYMYACIHVCMCAYTQTLHVGVASVHAYAHMREDAY